MAVADEWRALFERWPKHIPRKGILITVLNESIPFCNFMVSPGLVIVERERPDSLGARKVIVVYEQVAAVKIVDPIDLVQFQGWGFRPPA